jgi:hypothetical protein
MIVPLTSLLSLKVRKIIDSRAGQFTRILWVDDSVFRLLYLNSSASYPGWSTPVSMFALREADAGKRS